MAQTEVRNRWATGALLALAGGAALALSTAGCGGSAGVALPSIDASVTNAAQAAGCTVRGYPSQDGPLDAAAGANAAVQPPVAGSHESQWADWGVYDTTVPERYLVHNMAHGGIIVRLGADVPPSARRAVIALWSASPSYAVVVPGTTGVPRAGAVVTSWRRALRCPVFARADLDAVRAYLHAYRGVGGLHKAEPTNFQGEAPAPPDLPTPVRADPDA